MASPASAPSPISPIPTTSQLTFTELFNKWVQSIGIIVAAFWGAYTFIYKEVEQPKSVPINITIATQLKKLGTTNLKKSLVPIEVRISATNPSSRRVYLLPSKWMVWSYKMVPKEADDLDVFYKLAADSMNRRSASFVDRYSSSGKRNVVAGGGLFSDIWLNPNETVARTIILYLPRDQYDSIVAQTVIPSLDTPAGLALEWKFDKQSEMITSDVYLVNERGERSLAKTSADGRVIDQRAKELGFQVATSSAELSLWE